MEKNGSMGIIAIGAAIAGFLWLYSKGVVQSDTPIPIVPVVTFPSVPTPITTPDIIGVITTPAVDECGVENPKGSGCYPNATGSHCNVGCKSRCTDANGNYKPCDDSAPINNNPYAAYPGYDPLSPSNPCGLYPDSYGNLMSGGKEICHRGDKACAHNLKNCGAWQNVYDVGF